MRLAAVAAEPRSPRNFTVAIDIIVKAGILFRSFRVFYGSSDLLSVCCGISRQLKVTQRWRMAAGNSGKFTRVPARAKVKIHFRSWCSFITRSSPGSCHLLFLPKSATIVNQIVRGSLLEWFKPTSQIESYLGESNLLGVF